MSPFLKSTLAAMPSKLHWNQRHDVRHLLDNKTFKRRTYLEGTENRMHTSKTSFMDACYGQDAWINGTITQLVAILKLLVNLNH